ncbi:MAG: selenocysteine-specific translation elongation factor [Acidobacteriota bacterium]
MKSIIIGTAGHIDHGKTELIKALTGVDTDRLKEEKERGITIDIGFASLKFGDDLLIGFVDVPGHERFVKNMLAGAGGIDIVILVVAADESVKPQTIEHFEICKLLGVKSGLIVLSKIDLVDEEVIRLVEMEMCDLIRGSFMEKAPIIPVSSRTGKGIDILKETIHDLALKVEEKSEEGTVRLPIDRSFSIKGFGTVVTGTLVSGRIEIGDELELLPAGKKCRVRGIEVHDEPREFARAGQRTALNLAGIGYLDLGRGMTLAMPGALKPARMIDARMNLLPSSPPLKNLSKVRFHHGTSEVMARVHILEADRLAPGSSMYVQLRMEKPVAVFPGDRFIVRFYSPTRTIGGGLVLDNDPRKHKTGDTSVINDLSILESGNEQERLDLIVASYGERGVVLQALVRRSGMGRVAIETLMSDLVQRGWVEEIPVDSGLFLSKRAYDQLKKKAKEEVLRFHRENPLSPGISKEELRRKAASFVHQELFESIVATMKNEGDIRVEGSLVIHRDHRIELNPMEQEIREHLEGEFRKGGLNPPEMKIVLNVSRFPREVVEKIFHLLLREEKLIKMKDERVFHQDSIAALKEKLGKYAEQKSIIDIATFKDMAGITRKNAIPLLEYFDSIKVTKRVGNERLILKENLK